MDFQLSDEQLALRETAHRFAEEEIAPVAAEFDEQEKFPRDLIEKAWHLGLMNLCIPEAYGGVGLGMHDACLVYEEVAWGCGGVGTSTMVNDLGLLPIRVGGSEEQKKEWFNYLLSDFTLISFCLSEPEAGSDVAGMQLAVEKDGESYILNGTKCWITNGGEADCYTLFGSLDRSSRHKGICAFVLPSDLPGITKGKKEEKLGHRASDTRVIHFDNVRVPAANRLGEEGEGFRIAMQTLDTSRPGIAALVERDRPTGTG